MTLLPLSSIVRGVRIRTDLGDIDALCASIKQWGFLQPLLLEDGTNRLVDGGRRYEAATRLGITEVPVFYRSQMTRGELHMLEVETNFQRKNMTWQEYAKGILLVHNFHQKNAFQHGNEWKQQQTAALLNVSQPDVSLALRVAKVLVSDPAHPLCEAENMHKALQLLVAQEVRLAEIESVKRIQAQRQAIVTDPEDDLDLPDVLPADVPSEKPVINYPSRFTVDLSHRIIHGDCLSVMREMPDASIDHIITDPPYAIDMDTLLGDTAVVNAEHGVDANMLLLEEFLEQAFRVTKPHSWVVLFCAPTPMPTLMRFARESGFLVQEWPLVWVKNNAQNRQAFKQYTKNYEFAIVLRRESATLRKSAPPAVITHPPGIISQRSALGNHPFLKPFALWFDLLANHCSRGDVVLDPFAGLGSSLQAFIAFGAEPIAIELNPHHYNSLLHNAQTFYRDAHGPAVTFAHAEPAHVSASASIQETVDSLMSDL